MYQCIAKGDDIYISIPRVAPHQPGYQLQGKAALIAIAIAKNNEKRMKAKTVTVKSSSKTKTKSLGSDCSLVIV
jgi:hypothetical protein